MAILVYGSLVPDIVFQIPHLPTRGEDVPAGHVAVIPAGGGGNVALALVSWGYGVTAAGNTVGTDPLGTWMADELFERGISVPDGFVSPSGLTTPNAILVTPDGERTIVGNDYTMVEWMEVPELDHIDAVMVDAYSGAAGRDVIRLAGESALPIVATDRTGPESADVHVLLLSSSEHSREEARRLAAAGPLVAMTAGGGPIEVYRPDGTDAVVRPPDLGVVDATGAGDVLAAATVARLTDGADPLTALRDAADTAARYVAAGRHRDMPPLTRMAP